MTGELSADDGEAAVSGSPGYMPQDVGVSEDQRTVRQLLLSLAPRGLRLAGERGLASPRTVSITVSAPASSVTEQEGIRAVQ